MNDPSDVSGRGGMPWVPDPEEAAHRLKITAAVRDVERVEGDTFRFTLPTDYPATHIGDLAADLALDAHYRLEDAPDRLTAGMDGRTAFYATPVSPEEQS